jgi:hypothetical protein
MVESQTRVGLGVKLGSWLLTRREAKNQTASLKPVFSTPQFFRRDPHSSLAAAHFPPPTTHSPPRRFLDPRCQPLAIASHPPPDCPRPFCAFQIGNNRPITCVQESLGRPRPVSYPMKGVMGCDTRRGVAANVPRTKKNHLMSQLVIDAFGGLILGLVAIALMAPCHVS